MSKSCENKKCVQYCDLVALGSVSTEQRKPLCMVNVKVMGLFNDAYPKI
jgi:hypothetical protein